MNNLEFRDSSNVAAITNQKIVNNLSWVGYVTHDLEDGAWQFLELNKSDPDPSEAVVVSLKEIINIDSTLKELMDLPLGWHAWRSTKESSWIREKNNGKF